MNPLSIINQPNSIIPAPVKSGFWKRQFQDQVTAKQEVYDWVFGVILPIICAFFDGIVFKGNSPLLGNYRAFAYLLSFVSISAMVAWLTWGAKLRWLNAVLAGLFLTGGFVSLAVGIVLFPFSLIGLLLIIGVLGFTPLFSSLVYLRNAYRAYHSAQPTLKNAVFAALFTFGVSISAIAPWIVNSEIKRSFEKMKYGNVQAVKDEAQKLKFIAPLLNIDEFSTVYYSAREKNDKEKMLVVIEQCKQIADCDYLHQDSMRIETNEEYKRVTNENLSSESK